MNDFETNPIGTAAELERLQKRVSDADECISEQEEEIEHLREQVVNLQTRNNALYEAIDILKRGGKLK
jgi:chromosome segregation ATPase